MADTRNYKILVVDDEAPALRSLARTLELNGFSPVLASSISEAKRCFADDAIDAGFLDIMLGNESGLDLLKWVVSHYPTIPMIMFTKLRDIDKAVSAVKSGAYDYLEKGVDNDRIVVTLNNAIKWSGLETQRNALVARLDANNRLLGDSQAMIQLRERIQKLATAQINVLIVGETGTGKELVARAIHNQSFRAANPLEIIDSTVLETLTEDTLFGHIKGAFTDAKERREGAFARADKGTLFLDEIGKLSLPVQAKLLRVLDRGTFVPLGSEREVQVDVRFLGATNRNLEGLVKQGLFHEDLLHRLKVGIVRVPPLRERREDIQLLSETFLAKEFKRNRKNQQELSLEARALLLAYDWPGNVRQLENLCEYLCVVNEGSRIEEEDVREWLYADSQPSKPVGKLKDYFSHLRDCKHDYFEQLLALHGGNVAQAAQAAGIDKAGCYRLLKTLGLHPRSGEKSTS